MARPRIYDEKMHEFRIRLPMSTWKLLEFIASHEERSLNLQIIALIEEKRKKLTKTL